MEDAYLDPKSLQPVNSPFNAAHRQSLADRMRQDGWRGRPLLVEEVRAPNFNYAQHFAWTGSHRIVAAIEASLKTVPCRVLTALEANTAFTLAGYTAYWLTGCPSWRHAITSAEGPDDQHRLRGLEKAGLEEAADMLRAELAATNGHGA